MANETKEVVKTTEEPKMCKRSEILGHALDALGHDAMSNLHGTWITPFMTDVMVLPSAFLGILLAAARIFDGITDVAMGFIAQIRPLSRMASALGSTLRTLSCAEFLYSQS